LPVRVLQRRFDCVIKGTGILLPAAQRGLGFEVGERCQQLREIR